MATGLKAFRRAQLGKETVAGTAVAATRVLTYDTLDISDEMSFHEPVDERVSLSMHHRSQVKAEPPVKLALKGDLLFDEIVYWLQGAARGGVAPTQPDAAVDLYTITPLYTAANTQTTYTIEAGDNEQEIEVNYCTVESIELDWGVNEPVKLSVNMFGQKIAESTFTGSLASASVETALGNNVEVFCDTAWAGIAGTEVADILVSGKIKISSGLTPVKRADGTIFMTKTAQGRRRLVEAELTFDHDATSKAYRALYRADTKRFWAVHFTGSVITGAFFNFLKVQFCAGFRGFGEGDDDEINTRTVKLASIYDATGSAEAKFLAQNALNTVTEF